MGTAQTNLVMLLRCGVAYRLELSAGTPPLLVYKRGLGPLLVRI